MLTDEQLIHNAKLSIDMRLNLLVVFDWDEDDKQRMCREISNAVAHILIIEHGNTHTQSESES